MRSPFARPPKRAGVSPMWIGAGVGLALVVSIIIAGFMLSANEPEPVPQAALPTDAPNDVQSAAATSAASPPVATVTSAAADIDDDGQTLWKSPTSGRPVSLEYLPAGCQMFLVLRPAELLANREGDRLLAMPGATDDSAQSDLQTILGINLAEVDQLAIGFFGDAGLSEAVFTMRLRTIPLQRTLLDNWSNPAPAEHNGKKFFEGKRWAYYLPPKDNGRTVVVAPTSAMRAMLDMDGPPPLGVGLEKLLQVSDETRHIQLFLVPGYLLTEANRCLTGELEKLRDPLAALLGEDWEAALLSAHLGAELFLEFRGLPRADRDSRMLAPELLGRLKKMSADAEKYIASLRPHPHGRRVIERFPRMIALASQFTRAGIENRQVLLNCYLPLVAAHNLLLGAQLTLAEGASISAPAAPVTTAPTGAQAALARKITLVVPRDTLEHTLELFSKEIETDVVILGSDLQLEGIAKNQSFGLDERDEVADVVLRKVLQLASPAGKLVYVIRARNDGREAIFVTTLKAATKRGDPLPPALAPKSPPEKP